MARRGRKNGLDGFDIAQTVVALVGLLVLVFPGSRAMLLGVASLSLWIAVFSVILVVLLVIAWAGQSIGRR
jgi:hypothetical protein